MPGTLELKQCSSYYKDTGRGVHTLFHHCTGDFAPDTGQPLIPDVTPVEDIRGIPRDGLLRGVVVPGDNRSYRPEPSGTLYCLPLLITPLFLAFAALRIANSPGRAGRPERSRTRWRLRVLAYAGMAVTALAGIPATFSVDWLRNGGSWW